MPQEKPSYVNVCVEAALDNLAADANATADRLQTVECGKQHKVNLLDCCITVVFVISDFVYVFCVVVIILCNVLITVFVASQIVSSGTAHSQPSRHSSSY